MFDKKGIDVSSNQGIIRHQEVPAMTQSDFVIMRTGYGRTVDKQFINNWNGFVLIVDRGVYPYIDYYSNWYNKYSPAYGLSDIEWGKEQAENCYKLLGGYKGIVWADIENGDASYSPPLTDPVAKEHAQTILLGFLTRIDQLNGHYNGIYKSVGWLYWLYKKFRDRPLFVAWYNDFVDVEDVVYACRMNGWVGDIYIWQHSDDGNGKDICESHGLDMDKFIGTREQYVKAFGIETYKLIMRPITIIHAQPDKKSKVIGVIKWNKPIEISGISGGWGKLFDRKGFVETKYLKLI